MTRALLERVLDALMTTGTLRASQQAKETAAIEAIRAELAKPQGEPVAAAGEDLAIYQSIADNYFKSIRPAHTEAEVQELLSSSDDNRYPDLCEDTIRRILGVNKP